jgi:uncharacterized protein
LLTANRTGLLDGHLLIQGAGKTWTLRRLMEQSAGRIQQIIVDPLHSGMSLIGRYIARLRTTTKLQ